MSDPTPGARFDPDLADRLKKPAKGSDFIARKTAKKAIRTHELKVKDEVRRLDRSCRWPHCTNCRTFHPRLEVAHRIAKGIGGDHSVRTTPENLILLDYLTHQGSDGLEQHRKYVEPLTDLGTRGPCAFYEKRYSETRAGEWTWHCVGVERSPGVLDPTITDRVLGVCDYDLLPVHQHEGASMTDEQKTDETPTEPQAPTDPPVEASSQADGDPGPKDDDTADL